MQSTPGSPPPTEDGIPRPWGEWRPDVPALPESRVTISGVSLFLLFLVMTAAVAAGVVIGLNIVDRQVLGL